MAELAWGVKRTCNGCGARFYDLRKSPAACPKCGVTFELLTAVRGKRGRTAAKEVALPLDDLDLVSTTGLVSTTVSLSWVDFLEGIIL